MGMVGGWAGADVVGGRGGWERFCKLPTHEFKLLILSSSIEEGMGLDTQLGMLHHMSIPRRHIIEV